MKNWLNLPKRRREAEAPRRRTYPDPELPEATLRTAWQLVSLLLDYPSVEGTERLGLLREAAAALPEQVSAPLLRLVDHLAGTELQVAQKDYVDTFDTTRKCALHLTYYAYGDTRRRGIALVQFKQAFRRGGLEVIEDELPDHLAVLLEFGATGEDISIAWRLLNDHRAGIEMLQMGLDNRPSAWADAINALRATLPALDGEQAEAVAKLLAEGPPDEEVGLDTYSLDPRLNPPPDADLMDESFAFGPDANTTRRAAQGVPS